MINQPVVMEPRRWNGGERFQAAPQLFGEPVKGSELPALPPLGTDQSPLAFGDWLTLVRPAMYDLANQAR